MQNSFHVRLLEALEDLQAEDFRLTLERAKIKLKICNVAVQNGVALPEAAPPEKRSPVRVPR